jgi:hypothetical protein
MANDVLLDEIVGDKADPNSPESKAELRAILKRLTPRQTLATLMVMTEGDPVLEFMLGIMPEDKQQEMLLDMVDVDPMAVAGIALQVTFADALLYGF